MGFSERLSVPARWWFLALGFAGSAALGLGFYLGWPWALGAALVSLAAAAELFRRAAVRIVVDDERVMIGRAEIDHRYLAGAQALDADATRRRAGIEADARAHLVLRPYVATAVEIVLDDPADPVPYWLVSSRRAPELAAALQAAADRISR